LADDFKLLIEQVKLHSPIEDVVRERVPTLRRAGALWVACCPFHEEKTPSFKVDPRRGTWNCYGACGTGGDQLSFVQRAYNVDFREALEILAGRAGIALAERGARDAASKEQYEELYGVLARAEEFYRRWLRRPEAAHALAYVRDRGLSDATIDAFGVGFAPAGGRELTSRAASQGLAIEKLVSVGLARTDSEGRAYDFFQGRLMIPVRDIKGRTIGFGARRLSDEDKRSPKYVNTPETVLFHKGRVIYALDRALDHVRKNGHLVLVEGYTDVMAAHQVGLRSFVAVLGTATTDDHAALVRRSGARRVSLLFDADDAGRKATWRALDGLLALDIKLDVVRLVGDKDPCELVMREGVAPLEAQLAQAVPWFEFLVEGVLSAHGEERGRESDRVLALLARIAKPTVRDDWLSQFARRLDMEPQALRKQFETLPERRREQQRAREAALKSPSSSASAAWLVRDGAAGDVTPLHRAFCNLAAGVVREPSLALGAEDLLDNCPQPLLRRVIESAADAARRYGQGCVADQIMLVLGTDPARDIVGALLSEFADVEDVADFFEHNLRVVRAEVEQSRIQALKQRESDYQSSQLRELHQLLTARLS
jgi:DNA primase